MTLPPFLVLQLFKKKPQTYSKYLIDIHCFIQYNHFYSENIIKNKLINHVPHLDESEKLASYMYTKQEDWRGSIFYNCSICWVCTLLVLKASVFCPNSIFLRYDYFFSLILLSLKHVLLSWKAFYSSLLLTELNCNEHSVFFPTAVCHNPQPFLFQVLQTDSQCPNHMSWVVSPAVPSAWHALAPCLLVRTPFFF